MDNVLVYGPFALVFSIRLSGAEEGNITVQCSVARHLAAITSAAKVCNPAQPFTFHYVTFACWGMMGRKQPPWRWGMKDTRWCWNIFSISVTKTTTAFTYTLFTVHWQQWGGLGNHLIVASFTLNQTHAILVLQWLPSLSDKIFSCFVFYQHNSSCSKCVHLYLELIICPFTTCLQQKCNYVMLWYWHLILVISMQPHLSQYLP